MGNCISHSILVRLLEILKFHQNGIFLFILVGSNIWIVII